jgi:hypothetical protein
VASLGRFSRLDYGSYPQKVNCPLRKHTKNSLETCDEWPLDPNLTIRFGNIGGNSTENSPKTKTTEGTIVGSALRFSVRKTPNPLSNQLAAEPHYRGILHLDLSQYQSLPDKGHRTVDGKRPTRKSRGVILRSHERTEISWVCWVGTHASRTAFACRAFSPRMGVVEEFSQLEGGTRDTRLY